jgi:hypothetical protein
MYRLALDFGSFYSNNDDYGKNFALHLPCPVMFLISWAGIKEKKKQLHAVVSAEQKVNLSCALSAQSCQRDRNMKKSISNSIIAWL